MISRIQKLVSEYKNWYEDDYVSKVLLPNAEDAAEIKKNQLESPYVRLKPVQSNWFEALEVQFGTLPQQYKSLISEVGVGILLCAAEEEPFPCYLIPPDELADRKKALLSWMGSRELESAKKQGIDASKVLPFMTLGYKNEPEFALLGMQKNEDDRVYLWSHEEGGIFNGPRAFEEFLEIFFAKAKALKRLGTFSGWQ